MLLCCGIALRCCVDGVRGALAGVGRSVVKHVIVSRIEQLQLVKKDY